MALLQEHEILELWNNNMKRAASCAKEMSEDTVHGGMWNMVAAGIDELRRRGNIMAQSKAMSEQALTKSLASWELRLGKKTDAEVEKTNKENKKKGIIIDG